MTVIDQSNCPLHNKVPIPRVLHNQLDRHIESHIVKIEDKLLHELQSAMRKKKTVGKTVIFLAVVIILNALERDIGRLLFWVIYLKKQKQVRYLYTVRFSSTDYVVGL